MSEKKFKVGDLVWCKETNLRFPGYIAVVNPQYVHSPGVNFYVIELILLDRNTWNRTNLHTYIGYEDVVAYKSIATDTYITLREDDIYLFEINDLL